MLVVEDWPEPRRYGVEVSKGYELGESIRCAYVVDSPPLSFDSPEVVLRAYPRLRTGRTTAAEGFGPAHIPL